MNFTEEEYRDLIRRVKKEYRFLPFTNYNAGLPHVLWRHDIDMSPKRAARLAEIEDNECVQSTYFLHLHSAFYNLFEEDVAKDINEIVGMGHVLGLHYDPAFYQCVFPRLDPFEMMESEREFVWDTFNVKPMAISFHNPSFLTAKIPSVEKLCGMVNTNSTFILANYKYYSDSNCVWKEDVLRGQYPRLHVLTHPEWWTKEPLERIEKVNDIIDSRANYQRIYYNDILRRI